MEDNDAAVVERVRAGDTEAFRALVERHSRAVFRLTYRMTGNEHDAEDMVQEAFLRAYKQLGSFDHRASFSTWLCKIAANCSLDLLRSRQRRKESSEPLEADGSDSFAARSPAPDRIAFSGEVRVRLQAAMGELSPMEKTAFVLRHFEGVPIEEISRTIGRPNGATRHCVFRAVQKLRRALEPLVDTSYEASH